VIQRIAAARNMPRAAAAVVARRENPELYQSYQDSGLQGNAEQTNQQLVIPSATMVKSSNDFEAAVQLEIQKYGISREAAEQRVSILHPTAAQGHITKSADTGVADFMKCVEWALEDDRGDAVAAVRGHDDKVTAFRLRGLDDRLVGMLMLDIDCIVCDARLFVLRRRRRQESYRHALSCVLCTAPAYPRSSACRSSVYEKVARPSFR
jgi:hypothetical protein